MQNETRGATSSNSSNNNSGYGNARKGSDDIFDRAPAMSRDIDVIDLKFMSPDPSIEMVNMRKTKKLISTDINIITGQIDNPVKGSRNNRRRRSRHHTSSLASLSGLEDDIFSTSRNNASTQNEKPKTPVFFSNPSMRRKSIRDRGSPTPSQGTLIDNLRSDEENGHPASAGTSGGFSRRKSHTINLSASNASRGASSRLSKRSSGKTRNKGPSYAAGRPGSRSGATGSAQKKRKKTPKLRCNHSECRKRLNITNGFPCRCQKVFCAKHRLPESHHCTVNYKEEGRKLLEEANPIVTCPKLPKI